MGVSDRPAQVVRPFKRASWYHGLVPSRLIRDREMLSAPLRVFHEVDRPRLVGDESQAHRLQGSCPSGQDNPEARTYAHRNLLNLLT